MGNDENVIEKCLAAKNGDAEQITQSQQFTDAYAQISVILLSVIFRRMELRKSQI